MVRYSVRPATAADFHFMGEVKFAGLRDYVEQVYGWDQQDQERRFREWFDPVGSQVILQNGTPVGYFHVVEEEGEVLLAGIYIAVRFQRQGIGTDVIEGLLREAQLKGKEVALRVLKSNPAKALYERIGFRVVRETKTHFEMLASSEQTGRSKFEV